MKASIRNLLIILLTCTFAGQALAQSVQIGSASGSPGDTVLIPITFTAGPSPARDVSAIQVILGFSETYDDVDSTAGAPLCGGDVAPLAAELCQWGFPGQPLLYQMTQVSANPYPSAVIARINFTIPVLAVGGEDLVVASSSLIGDAAGELDPPVPVLSGSITVIAAAADQTITGFVAVPATGTVGGTSTLSATASSGLVVTFGSSTPLVCTVVGTTVTYNVGGSCTVTADQAGDASFNPAPQVTLAIGIDKTDQTITGFAADPAAGVVGGSSALSATASSGLAVDFGSSTPGVCIVLGSTVNYQAAGTCTVTADQAGDDDFNAAPQVSLGITVAIADQDITFFTANPDFGFIGGTSLLNAIGGGSSEPVIFGSNTPAICTVVGSAVTYLAVGVCIVTADQAGDANYNAAPQITLDIIVTEFAPISAEPIPTLSQWGLALLLLLMLSMGGIVIRRKDVG